jgi:hypothetical protein
MEGAKPFEYGPSKLRLVGLRDRNEAYDHSYNYVSAPRDPRLTSHVPGDPPPAHLKTAAPSKTLPPWRTTPRPSQLYDRRRARPRRWNVFVACELYGS